MLNLIAQAMPLIVGVVVVPILLRDLGPSRFGIVSIGWLLAGNLGLFDLGLTRAITKFVAEFDERTMPAPAMTRMISSALAVQMALGLGGGIVLAALAAPLARDILNVPQDLLTEATRTFLVLSLSVPLLLLSLAFRGVLEGRERFDLLASVRVPLSTGNYLLPLLGLRLGWGLVGIASSLVVLQAFGLVAYRALSANFFEPARTWPRLERAALAKLIGYGRWITISQFVGPVLVYADRFVLGAFVSVAAVGIYVAPLEVMMRLAVIPTSFAGAIFPLFTSLGRGGSGAVVGDLAGRAMKYVVLVMGTIAIIVAAYATPLLQAWLGVRGTNLATVVSILLLGVVANAVAQIPYSLLQAMGRPDLTAKLHLMELPVHMILLGLLVSAWGITGAAAAWSLRSVVDLFLLAGIAHRLSYTRATVYVTERIPLLIAVLGAVGVGVVAVAQSWDGVRIPELAVVATIVAVGAVVISRWVLLERDRALLTKLVGRTP